MRWERDCSSLWENWGVSQLSGSNSIKSMDLEGKACIPVEFYLWLVLLLTWARDCICRGSGGGSHAGRACVTGL